MPAALPPLYAPWVHEVLGGAIPKEAAAACRRCVMLAPGRSGEGKRRIFFDAKTLCCTYLPDLPNFLVGRILSDRSPAMAYGRRTVRDRLRRQAGVTPFGLARPALYSLLYDSGAADGFGRSRSLHCPHHVDGGPCGIWAHRCAVCATWFC